MRILMTGATGFIGNELGKRLVGAGHEITAVSRSVARAKKDLPFPARLVAWGGAGENFPLSAFEDVDAVVHLAGESIADGRWTDERKRRIRDSRVLGTRALIDAIVSSESIRKRLKAFVLGSAIGYYGDRGDETLDESSTAGVGFLAEVVKEWEGECDRLREAPQIRLALVRTGVVLGKNGGALQKMLPIFSAGLGGPLGSGEQWMSWIHLNDIAGVFLHAVINDSVSGVLNGVAPQPVTNETFTRALGKVLRRPTFFRAPAIALKIALGELSTAVLNGQRVVPRQTLAQGYVFQFPEIQPALQEIL